MALKGVGRPRGLGAFEESRELRRRAVVLGRVSVREPSTKFWLWTFAGLTVFAFGYCGYADRKIAQRAAALAAHHAQVVSQLGPEAPALAERLAQWVTELSHPAADVVTADINLAAIKRAPALYARVALTESTLPPAAVARSTHDGFTSCFFVNEGPPPVAGEPCSPGHGCSGEQTCNERGRCAAPTQPFDLRYLVAPLPTLASSWLEQANGVSNEYALRALELELERAEREQVALARLVAKKARYFVAILDEAPVTVAAASGDPAQEENAAQGETVRQRLQTSEHQARVGIWDLASGRLLVRLRAPLEAELRPMGRGAPLSLEVQRAGLRQAYGCSLALAVEEQVGEGSAVPAASAP
jgi:hypothetical protein